MGNFKAAFFVLFFFAVFFVKAEKKEFDHLVLQNLSTGHLKSLVEQGPGPFAQLLLKQKKINRKATAAILAFPFPFGIAAVHRIYLGCAPYIPIVYMSSLGGIFGLVPLIDFIMILRADDVEQFANSGKVFMWVD